MGNPQNHILYSNNENFNNNKNISPVDTANSINIQPNLNSSTIVSPFLYGYNNGSYNYPNGTNINNVNNSSNPGFLPLNLNANIANSNSINNANNIPNVVNGNGNNRNLN